MFRRIPRTVVRIAVTAALLVGSLAGCSSAPLKGDAAPGFSGRDAAGNEVSMAQLDGKVVVLDFWATWCAPCRTVSPAIQSLHEQFAGDGDVVVLGVHYDGKGTPAEYMIEHGYTFPTIVDGTEVVKAYRVTKIPTLLVIDRNGLVVHSQVGFTPGDEVEIAAIVHRHR